MKIPPPKTLKNFVDTQVSQSSYGTFSEYVRELIRKDQDRQKLRTLLVDGAESEVTGQFDQAYFDGLHSSIEKQTR